MNGWGVSTGHVYEFGVYKGRSMRDLQTILKPVFTWGFDSFQGLPKDTAEPDKMAQWSEGAFSADPREELNRSIGVNKVGFVEGFYDKSLTDGLVHERGMRPAQYIGIDCDLYESTQVVLDWAFRAGIAIVGTLIGYDDFWVIPCVDGESHPLASGEGRAHREISQKYDVEFACVAGPCTSSINFTRWEAIDRRGRKESRCGAHATWGPIFVVVSIGKGRGTHGFETDSHGVNAFRNQSGTCLFHACAHYFHKKIPKAKYCKALGK
jgi:hypothetical protein